MWVPDLADPVRMAAVLADHAEALGLPGGVGACEVLDVRLSNPHRPDSPRCTGWGTYRVLPADRGAQAEGRPEGGGSDDGGSDAGARWYVRAYPPGGAARAWAVERAARPRTAARLLADVDLVAWPFPHDPALPGLADLLDPRSAAPYLGMTGPDRPARASAPEDDVDVAVVRYQPEVSAVVRYRRRGTGPGTATGTGGVYAKLLAPGVVDVARVAELHRRLWESARAGGDLAVAEPLGADLDRGVLWTREVAGEPLVGVLDGRTADAVADRLAALTAALHASGVAPPAAFSLRDHVTEAEKKVAKLATAHPAAAEPLAAVLARGRELAASGRADEAVGAVGAVGAAGAAGAAGARSVTVHGDLHVDQVLHTPTGLVLLDLDSVTSGPPELDLAELVVDLVLRPVPDDVPRRLVPRLLRAYATRAAVALDPAVLRALADAEFVNRLYRHLRRHAPGWERGLWTDLARHAQLDALLDDV